MGDEPIKTMPVQVKRLIPRDSPRVPSVVALRAYEVYCEVFDPQPEMVTGHCRGGFGVSELISFLYARSFPKSEWQQRMEEASKGMESI